jgi:hypothetical protein
MGCSIYFRMRGGANRELGVLNLSSTGEQKDLGVRAFPGAGDNKGVLGQEKAGRNQLAWGHLNPIGKLAESR